jgi:hypothetical protein
METKNPKKELLNREKQVNKVLLHPVITKNRKELFLNLKINKQWF